MDKDEILKRSREENKDRDFVEEAVLAKANSIALCVGIFMCGIISILKGLLTEKGTEPAVWTVYFSVLATTIAGEVRENAQVPRAAAGPALPGLLRHILRILPA